MATRDYTVEGAEITPRARTLTVKRLFFIGISSLILPRKFYFRIPLTMGRITT